MFTTQVKSIAGMVFAVISGLAATGCSQSSPFKEWTEVDPRSHHRFYEEAGESATQPTKPHAPALPPTDATLADYVRVTLARNPDIKRARHEVEAALAEVPQVTSLDDPMLMVSPIGEMAQTAAGEVGAMTSLSQKLPFPGKLEARGEAALAEARVAKANLTETRLRVVADTRRAYWGYYDMARSIAVVERSRELLEQFEQTAQAAYAAGQVPQQDVLRAQVELEELKQEVLTLRQRLEAQVARLNALMDRPVDAPLPPPAPAETQAVDLQLDDVLALAKQTNPELLRIRQQIAAARHRLDLAELERWPDLTAAVNYNLVEDEGLAGSPTGDDQWWLSLGVNLPIWTKKYDAAEREARQRILATLADLQRAHNDYAAHLRELLADVDTEQRLVELFRGELIPKSRQALDASRAAYQAGDAEFANIIDNWQKLLRYRRLYHTAIADLAAAFAEIEQVVGQELPRQPVEPTKPAEPTNEPDAPQPVEPPALDDAPRE